MELFVKGVKFSTYFECYHPIITESYLDKCGRHPRSRGSRCTRSCRCCWCSARTHHRVWKCHNVTPWSSLVCSSPVFAFIFVRHGTSLAAPAVIAVTLGVQTRTIDTTVASCVQTVIWKEKMKIVHYDLSLTLNCCFSSLLLLRAKPRCATEGADNYLLLHK